MVKILAGSQLLPSEAVHLTQWISIGDEQTAKSNVEHYTSVSLYPYPNGKIPIILTSYMDSLNTTSEEDFNATLNAHEKFREIGVANYTEAVCMRDINVNRMNKLLELGTYIIGQEDMGGENMNITSQERKIKRMLEDAQSYKIDLKGFVPKELQYDLDTIKTLADQNMTFILAKVIIPAFDILFQEGLRHPQIAYYHGDTTNLVLVPISLPTISGPTYFYSDRLMAWEAVIDSVIRNEDLCVFLWDSEKVGKSENINDIINVTRYAREKGMTFTTPYEIANHFLLLQNVSAVVSKEENKVVISLTNNNNEPVNGVTFRIEMPGTNEEWIAENGNIARKVVLPSACIYYVSADLDAGEIKDMALERK